jgi:hypothetical protein
MYNSYDVYVKIGKVDVSRSLDRSSRTECGTKMNTSNQHGRSQCSTLSCNFTGKSIKKLKICKFENQTNRYVLKIYMTHI